MTQSQTQCQVPRLPQSDDADRAATEAMIRSRSGVNPAQNLSYKENLSTARALYEAFARQDSGAIMALIAPDFHGVVAAGMPAGLAGSYHGAEEMLQRCWSRVFALVDVRPVPDEYLVCTDGRIVVTGTYIGAVRASGKPLNAAFAHVLRCGDGRVRELIQITDTDQWRRALRNE